MQLVHIDATAVTGNRFQLHWLLMLGRLLAVVIGALHTWAAIISYSMNADGIAYLDMGDAYFRGDWAMAINAYWSPFYAWLLGLGMHILTPSMRWEFPAVHLINFVIYLTALGCFEFFWRQLIRSQREKEGEGDDIGLPDWCWWALGYALFIWSSLSLIKIWSVTPDMCVASFVYLAAGCILRIQAGTVPWHRFALFGIILGLGYLSKAAMFPIAFVFLGVGLFSVEDRRRAISLTLFAFAFFALLGGPFIAALSHSKSRLTFGDSGKLNYARYVNGLPTVHWQEGSPANGALIHPTRKILDNPPIYEFATPVHATYPPWYDSSYWYEGVKPHFNIKEQVNRLLVSVQFYFDLFLLQQGGLLVGVLILYLMGRRPSFQLKGVIQRWSLVLVALSAFGMYAVVYAESRYIAAFVVLFWAGLLVKVRLPNSQTGRRLVTSSSIAMIVFMLMSIVAFNLEGFSSLVARQRLEQAGQPQAPTPSWPGEVAQELHQLGIQPGDNVAVIGYAFDSSWARLARVRIVAEMFEWEADPFWRSSSVMNTQVIQAFARTGAKAIVAEHVPSHAALRGWNQVGNSNYYIYLLNL